MTYHSANGQNGNRLAEKLRREYRNRGAALSGISASSTEELMARAQMGRNPNVNVSEQAFAEAARRRTSGYTGRQNYSTHQSGYSGKNTGKTAAYNNRYKGPEHSTKERHESMPEQREILVEKKRFPLTFLLLLSFVTVMIMMIILSIAQIYETTDEISVLKHRINSLQTTAAELELKIEEKNDIRIIEQIATDQLGMVKEDSVQKKYISLSDGERIELVNDKADENIENGFASMLSSIWAAFGDFFAGLQ